MPDPVVTYSYDTARCQGLLLRAALVMFHDTLTSRLQVLLTAGTHSLPVRLSSSIRQSMARRAPPGLSAAKARRMSWCFLAGPPAQVARSVTLGLHNLQTVTMVGDGESQALHCKALHMQTYVQSDLMNQLAEAQLGDGWTDTRSMAHTPLSTDTHNHAAPCPRL